MRYRGISTHSSLENVSFVILSFGQICTLMLRKQVHLYYDPELTGLLLDASVPYAVYMRIGHHKVRAQLDKDVSKSSCVAGTPLAFSLNQPAGNSESVVSWGSVESTEGLSFPCQLPSLCISLLKVHAHMYPFLTNQRDNGRSHSFL